MELNASDELDRLLEFDHWEEVALAFAGFLLPTLVQVTLEGRGIVSLPNEAYGITAMVGSGIALDGEYRKAAGVGAGVYTVDQLLNRFGIKQTIAKMGA